MQHNRLPLVPADILSAHKVHETGDTRFQAAARLLQALWREQHGLPIGIHCPQNGEPRKLGSRIEAATAKQGANFMSPDIARLAFREFHTPGPNHKLIRVCDDLGYLGYRERAEGCWCFHMRQRGGI